MQHVEVYLESFWIVSFQQPLTQIEAPLAALASFTVWTIDSLTDQVAELSGSVLPVFELWLGDKQSGTTAHRKCP